MAQGAEQQKLAVDTGHWPLLRYDPRRVVEGESALQMDSANPKTALTQFLKNEARFRMVEQQHPERYKTLVAAAQREVSNRYSLYEQMSKVTLPVRTAKELEQE